MHYFEYDNNKSFTIIVLRAHNQDVSFYKCSNHNKHDVDELPQVNLDNKLKQMTQRRIIIKTNGRHS